MHRMLAMAIIYLCTECLLWPLYIYGRFSLSLSVIKSAHTFMNFAKFLSNFNSRMTNDNCILKKK